MDLLIKILIVDDMPGTRLLLKSKLASLGFVNVMEAEDGEQAWEWIRKRAAAGTEAFDLVICDWQMPGLSGIELLRSVRGFAPTRRLPFLLVTAEGDRSFQLEAEQAGASGFVLKPFSHDELTRAIAEAAGGTGL